MKKFFSFLITLFFYFLVYGALHEMFGESISLLHPSTKTNYLWGIISFSLMGILIFKRTYFPNTDTEEKASNQTRKYCISYINYYACIIILLIFWRCTTTVRIRKPITTSFCKRVCYRSNSSFVLFVPFCVCIHET